MANPNAVFATTPSSFGRQSRIVTPGATAC